MEIIRHYLSAVAGWVGINIWPYSQQEILHDPQAFDRFMSELIGSSTCSLSRLNLLGEDASKRFVEQMHGYLGIDVAYLKKLLGNTIYDTMAASDGGIDVDEDGVIDNWGSSTEPCQWKLELNLFGSSALFDASFYGVRKE